MSERTERRLRERKHRNWNFSSSSSSSDEEKEKPSEITKKITPVQQKEDEITSPRPNKPVRKLKFKIEDKLFDPKFSRGQIRNFSEILRDNSEKLLELDDNVVTVLEMNGEDFNAAFFQRFGFNRPIIFRDKKGLGLRVPASNFTIGDVRTCVGSRRLLDVIDVETQKNQQMTMKEWQKYYEENSDKTKENSENSDKNDLVKSEDNPSKYGEKSSNFDEKHENSVDNVRKKSGKLLNVISLEFSKTKLENYVESPSVVRQLDWVDTCWPPHLKALQTSPLNSLSDMKYPKVQKYCLMSLRNCWTDFHIDFGGSSVWYHVIRGKKWFFLAPPTDVNLRLYENWVKKRRNCEFFADLVKNSHRVSVEKGETFLIPSGWIHGVFTGEDSLVFGGNFLHSFSINLQLKVAKLEENLKVPQKFRYPFFTEMLWFVLDRYVTCLMGRSHLKIPDNFTEFIDHSPNIGENTGGVTEKIHMTNRELQGLKEIVLYLHNLPPNRKNVPELLKSPIDLIHDVRQLINLHRNDLAELSITNRSIIARKIRKKIEKKVEKKGGIRRRRTRCKKCAACKRRDCGECTFCLDMIKFGGSGRAKQTCFLRQCLAPNLPNSALCSFCHLDGWYRRLSPQIATKFEESSRSALYECSVCYDICHIRCIKMAKNRKNLKANTLQSDTNRTNTDESKDGNSSISSSSDNLTGASSKFSDYSDRIPIKNESISEEDNKDDFSFVINEDLPNSWECPNCFKGSASRRNSLGGISKSGIGGEKSKGRPKNNEELKRNTCKLEDDMEENCGSGEVKKWTLPIKKRRNSDGGDSELGASSISSPLQLPPPVVKKPRNSAHLASYFTSNSTKHLRKPHQVVRPAHSHLNNQRNEDILPPNNLALDKRCILPVFRFLKQSVLFNCALVCKTWSCYSIDSSLWRKMEFLKVTVTSDILKGIVRRQPERLHFDWCHVTKQQLIWLLPRLSTSLRRFSLISVEIRTLSAFRNAQVSGTCCSNLVELDLSFINSFNDVTTREIFAENSTNQVKFRNLKILKMAGTGISDVSMRYLTKFVPELRELSLAFCTRITDAGIAQLCHSPSRTVQILETLDLSHSRLITEQALEHLSQLQVLRRLDLRHSVGVSTQALIRFAAKSGRDLQVKEVKLVVEKNTSTRV